MKVLFICTGNTCRSPIAEKLFQRYIGPCSEIISASAGTNAWVNGKMASASEKLLLMEGIDPSGFRSQQITEVLLREYDLILAMEKRHVEYVRDFFPGSFSKAFLLKSYVNEEAADSEIQDPYTKNNKAYEECFREIKEAVKKLKEKVCA